VGKKDYNQGVIKKKKTEKREEEGERCPIGSVPPGQKSKKGVQRGQRI